LVISQDARKQVGHSKILALNKEADRRLSTALEDKVGAVLAVAVVVEAAAPLTADKLVRYGSRSLAVVR